MRPRAAIRLLFFAAGLFALTELFALARPAEFPAGDRPRGDDGVKGLTGLTGDEVRRRFGPPARVSRQVYQLRCQEQWHYGAPHHLRLTFDWPRGQKARVVKSHFLAE